MKQSIIHKVNKISITRRNSRDKKTETAVIEVHKAFNQLWDVQQKFNQLTNKYKRYYDNLLLREQIIQSDMDYTIETANWVNLYQ